MNLWQLRIQNREISPSLNIVACNRTPNSAATLFEYLETIVRIIDCESKGLTILSDLNRDLLSLKNEARICQLRNLCIQFKFNAVNFWTNSNFVKLWILNWRNYNQSFGQNNSGVHHTGLSHH